MAKSSATSMSSAAAGIDEAAEVVERAELGMHGVVAALPAADGVGAAGIVRARP